MLAEDALHHRAESEYRQRQETARAEMVAASEFAELLAAEDASRAEATAGHANRLCLATHMTERELALERAKAASGIATRGAGRGLRYLPSLRGPGGLLPAASAGLG